MPPIPVRRLPTREVRIGNLPLGSDNPIRVQTMTSTPTRDVQASLEQCISLIEAGTEYVRLSIPDKASLPALKKIRQKLRGAGFHQPLIADIHFRPELALMSAPLVEKVRINPGNYYRAWKPGKTSWTSDEARQELDGLRNALAPLIETCKAHGTAIRIGTNMGSLSPRIVASYGHSPEAMAEATMEFLRAFEELDFFSTVISLKASDPMLMIRAHQAMARQMQREDMAYPVHLGVTEAGEGYEGRARSALGISALLKMGMGDTLRVSLTEPPEAEVAFARELLAQFEFINTAGLAPAPETQASNHRSLKSDTPKTASHKCNRMGLVITRPGPLPWEEGAYRIHPAGGRSAGTAVGTAVGTAAGTAAGKAGELAAGVSDPHPLVNVCMLDRLPGHDELKAVGALNGLVLVADTTNGFDPDELPQLHVALAEQHIAAEILVKLHVFSPEGDQTAGRLAGQAQGKPVATDAGQVPGKPAASDAGHVATDAGQAASDVGHVADRLLPFLASRFGDLLIGRIAGGFWLETDGFRASKEAGLAAEWLLQVAGLKNVRTSYISCPTCARTAYDLPEVLRQLKGVLPEVAGLKIAVMGCIVNGPGEMADAHFGLMGTGKQSLAIYQAGQLVKKNVDTRDAATELLALLMQNGWC